jgi:2-phospho-L-lactate/phosphoenolpyruvate guanylyltransferase
MIFALLPVKAPENAKQRLSGFMTPAQRESLARLMFEEVLTTLCAVKGLDRIAVATCDDAVASHARRAGVLVFEETAQRGHSHSADAAARCAKELGATTVMMVPIDTPLVTAAEIEDLIAAVEPGVMIVPSSDGTGTNAMVHTPPGAIECRFGPGSFEKHCEQARSKGLAVKVMRPPGLLFDIDTIEDVAELLARAPDSRTAHLLRNQWTCAS